MMRNFFALLFLLAVSGADAQQAPGSIRPLCPIRLGGVFTLGLADGADWLDASAAKGVKLSEANRAWIAQHCDVVALPVTSLTPDTFPKILREQSLFTPLLLAFASMLSEKPNGSWGDIGGWETRMAAWTLRDRTGKEIAPPEQAEQTHWMDFGNLNWAAHWRNQMIAQSKAFGASGVVASELPLANPAFGDNLARCHSPADRADATEKWMREIKRDNDFLLIPSALGFDSVAGHPTLPLAPEKAREDLTGRLWDEFYPVSDGAWDEGFLAPYWTDAPQPDAVRELHLEAADRAGRFGQVYIASGAYRNDDELEFLLASYLLIVHRQGRVVFQPMPTLPLFAQDDAGRSFAVFKQQILSRRAYFDAPLGFATGDRHLIAGLPARVWQRDYQQGIVYVNADDERSATLYFGVKMQRVNGQMVREATIPPHTGLILLNSDVIIK